MRHESLRCVSLCIDERDVMVDVADALQLVGVTVVMRAAVHADQEDRHVRPGQAEEVEFEFVHVGCFAVEKQQEAEHGGFGPGLPAVDGVVSGGFRVFLEVEFFYFLPAGHDAGAAAEFDGAPLLVEVLVVDCADVGGLGGEGGHVVAFELVVVVGHCVGEAADDGFGDVFVFGLGGPLVACDEVLVVVGAEGFEVHGT